MLAQLFIRNIAVIEKASIDLEKGFTVLTGETGAGKSIIIDAIHAVLGERTSKELVRTGTDSASVSALFTGLDEDTLSLLDRLSLPREEDGSLLIQRDIRLEGRSTCKINGAPATVSMLKQLGPRLVTIHGQHESYELLSPEVHMEYLDSFAGLESLLAESGLESRALARVCLGGALGEHMPETALERLGFLPQGLQARTVAEGNTSLRGAALLLTRPELRERLVRWSSGCTLVGLAGRPRFSALYMWDMGFG